MCLMILVNLKEEVILFIKFFEKKRYVWEIFYYILYFCFGQSYCVFCRFYFQGFFIKCLKLVFSRRYLLEYMLIYLKVVDILESYRDGVRLLRFWVGIFFKGQLTRNQVKFVIFWQLGFFFLFCYGVIVVQQILGL